MTRTRPTALRQHAAAMMAWIETPPTETEIREAVRIEMAAADELDDARALLLTRERAA